MFAAFSSSRGKDIMQGYTFRAICPETKELHIFQLVSDKGRTTGWCTKCLRVWPLTELTDGKDDDTGSKERAKPRKAKPAKRR